jgi:hypothetical protein
MSKKLEKRIIKKHVSEPLTENEFMSGFDQFLVCFTFFLINFTALFLPFILLTCLYRAIIYQDTFSTGFILITMSAMIYPSNIHVWPEFLYHSFWEYLWNYFSYKISYPENFVFSNTIPYIYAEFPHSFFPMGQFISQPFVSFLTRKETIKPGNEIIKPRFVKGGGADVTLLYPFVRQIYGWCGVISASKSSILQHIPTYNIALIPGGIAEMSRVSEDMEIVYLKKRKGFIKLALETGSSLVPVYHFGNTKILTKLNTSKSFDNFCRKVRFGFFYPIGRFLLPIPKRYPILTAVGNPITVVKNENPTEEDINTLHEIFVNKLVELFDEYKHCVGWNNRELVVQ